jgi:hypothetical protein
MLSVGIEKRLSKDQAHRNVAGDDTLTDASLGDEKHHAMFWQKSFSYKRWWAGYFFVNEGIKGDDGQGNLTVLGRQADCEGDLPIPVEGPSDEARDGSKPSPHSSRL